jgi:hypothetical protein
MTLKGIAVGLATLLAGSLGATAHAQDSGWRPFFSVTGAYQGDADLDGGGDFSSWGVRARGGVAGPLGSGGIRGGVTLDYGYQNYSFNDPVAFSGVAPWGIIQRYGVSVPLSFPLSNGWSLGFTPSADWFRENGASTDDALAWGAMFTGVKRFDNGNVIGLGVGAYDRLEESAVFPFLVINWRLGERWRLLNPLPSGPTGPAGLELDYEFESGWAAGVGAAWRVERFRLSESGPVPDGIGQERTVPVFLRVTRSFGEQMNLHLFLGALVAGQLRVENSSGDRVQEEDFDPAPFVGLTFTARF